jgi:hypothetical protein
VPALSSFIDGLTGREGLKESLTETEKSAEKWGARVRKVFDIVVELKEVAIATAAILTTMFVVSKIQAGVVATIALINTLIKAYNALKASAIVAGIASAFALNPLLGVGATAGAAAVLAAGNALARRNDTGQVSANIAGTGGNTVPSASLPSGFTTGASIPKTTGAPAITQSASPAGTTRSNNAPAVASAPIIKTPSGNAIPSNFDVAAARAGEERGNVIVNVNAPSAIDEEGFTRAVILALNRLKPEQVAEVAN